MKPPLTVGYQVARYAPHVVHLPQAAHRIFDEEEAGAERADDAERVAVHLVGPCGLLRLGCERAGGGVPAAVVADGGDAERGAVASCPDDVGPSEPMEQRVQRHKPCLMTMPSRDRGGPTGQVGEDALGSELHDVDVQARREPRVPIDREALVSPRPESVAQTLRAAEKFKYLHCSF